MSTSIDTAVTRSAEQTPMQRYQEDLAREGFAYDPAQAMAVEHLQRLYEDLLVPREIPGVPSARPKGLSARWSSLVGKRTRTDTPTPLPKVSGLYFWGGVGRGKTYLVDTFYEALPFERKMRTHFHRFMQRVHQEMDRLKGHKNPLDQVADTFAKEARVICFDEFFVKDITDAMILANLLKALFERNVVLVATSNIVPDDLYLNGLQRSRFLPAIDLLKQHCDVVNVDSGVDYRLRELTRVNVYHCPLDDSADRFLLQRFEAIACHAKEEATSIDINHRTLEAKRLHDGVVLFEFAELCDGPRSQNDYIELARQFHTVLVANVMQMGAETDDRARRFINLVDEFYDRGVKLLMTTQVPVDELYISGTLAFEFTRTLSRLKEMQSESYLALAHRP